MKDMVTFEDELSELKLKTVEDCAALYVRVDNVKKEFENLVDVYQGKALLEAKRIIWKEAGLEYGEKPANGNPVNAKWKEFALTLNCSQQQCAKLLDFAGYKEVEAEKIEAGEEVIEIRVASHYREVKKLTENKTAEEVIDTMYDAVEDNGGEIPKTAAEVKEVVTMSQGSDDEEPEDAESDWDGDEVYEAEVEESKNKADGTETLKKLMEKNRKLGNENDKLRAKIAKLEDNFEYATRLASVLKGLAINMRAYEREDRDSRKAFRNTTSLLDEALLILGFGKDAKPKLSEAKKVYRDMAKIHHPDVGGDVEQFKLLNDAYEAVKKALK